MQRLVLLLSLLLTTAAFPSLAEEVALDAPLPRLEGTSLRALVPTALDETIAEPWQSTITLDEDGDGALEIIVELSPDPLQGTTSLLYTEQKTGMLLPIVEAALSGALPVPGPIDTDFPDLPDGLQCVGLEEQGLVTCAIDDSAAFQLSSYRIDITTMQSVSLPWDEVKDLFLSMPLDLLVALTAAR